MNKNSVIGIILIIGIFVGYTVWMTPSKEERARLQHVQDSIYREQRIRYIQDSIRFVREQQAAAAEAAAKASEIGGVDVDRQLRDDFGVFASAASGEEKEYVIENNVIKLRFSSKGAYVKEVNLKDYQTYDSLPLIDFDKNTTKFNLEFFASNLPINSQDLYFTPYINNTVYDGTDSIVVGDQPLTISFRAMTDDEGEINPDQYIEFTYTVKPDEYMLDFDIRIVNMKNVIAANTNYVTLNWYVDLLKLEKAVDRYNGSNVYYKYTNDDVESLSGDRGGEKDGEKNLNSNLKWLSFKQRFFSYALISKDNFNGALIGMKTDYKSKNPRYLKTMYASVDMPFDGFEDDNTIQMQMYLGPNSLKIMDSYGLDLSKQIPLGGKLVGWINRYLVVNVFNWLGSYGWNYGIVILVLTIIIKLLLMPFAYKSYQSTAKMRVLKPEIDAISAKYPRQEDAMKKQQAVMDLYKKAGASPTSGCLPMLLQLPILWAIFRFFPSSIELRQQPFLWADDLSTYDSILDLPFNIPFYGDHVSLFTLLMTVTTILYTWINQKQTAAMQTQPMPGMKLMLYIMPIMFLGLFNSYSAGLSYYYMLVNVITFLQMYLFKVFLDDDKLRKQIEKAKLKPVKKSNFQKRLEEMQKQQAQMQKGRK
ncbi:MAG: membrane protein insertase YidC [Bacteroidales bacterium]|nr:membrane protein insertase YidC [Bacteroidales bacterium]